MQIILWVSGKLSVAGSMDRFQMRSDGDGWRKSVEMIFYLVQGILFAQDVIIHDGYCNV